MKRDYLRSMTAVMVMITAIAVCGCGNIKEKTSEIEAETDLSSTVDENGDANILNRDEAAQIKEEAGKDFDQAHEFDDLTEEMLTAVPDIESITQEDLFSMSIDEFRAFVAVYCPDYREYYGVNEDTVMTDDDWQSLRSLMSYNIFGKMWYQSKENDTYDLTEEDVEDSMLEIVYPDTDVAFEDLEEMIAVIENMTDEEFRAFIISVLEGEEQIVSQINEMTEEETEVFKEEILFYLKTELDYMQTEKISDSDAENETESSSAADTDDIRLNEFE